MATLKGELRSFFERLPQGEFSHHNQVLTPLSLIVCKYVEDIDQAVELIYKVLEGAWSLHSEMLPQGYWAEILEELVGKAVEIIIMEILQDHLDGLVELPVKELLGPIRVEKTGYMKTEIGR